MADWRRHAEITRTATAAATQSQALKVGVSECTAALDEATAINQPLRSELERQGKDVDALLAEKGTLDGALTQARARLEELRRAQAAAEIRAALFRNVALRLERMIDTGELLMEHMIAQGMAPNAVSAAGYGEFDPVAGNDSAEGRARNRRIEITLQPNIDEFVAVPTAF